MKVFLHLGAPPRTPIIACLYYIHDFSRKLKFRKMFHFSRIFSINFQIFINFNAYYWKIPTNFRALPNSKISFRPSKIGQTFILLYSLNQKIRHKLLIKEIADICAHLIEERITNRDMRWHYFLISNRRVFASKE